MELEYKYYEGNPSNIISTLKRSIGQYQRYYKYVKIGITANPQRRCAEHGYRDTTYCWERMVVVYGTTSIKNANKVEKDFINGNKKMTNVWCGESPMTPNARKYYAYLLLGNHRHYK
jgi:hypothetical protein